MSWPTLAYVQALLDVEKLETKKLRRAIKVLRDTLKAPSRDPSYVATLLAMTEHLEQGGDA